MSDIQHIYIKNVLNNNVLYIKDADLWGLQKALQHAINDGYADWNLEWHRTMYEALGRMRDSAIFTPSEFVDCTEENPCCERRNEYNGFASGPLRFVCPKHCSCHD